MDDYYSLLGIDVDASVDDIRGAYRERKDGLDTTSDAGKADAARLNKAWNVLSDPYQRGRYDEQRAGGAGSRTARATVTEAVGSRPPPAPPPAVGNGELGRQQLPPGAAADVRDAAPGRTKTATIALPPGTKFPAPKQRIIAMVIDLLVIIVLVSGSQIRVAHRQVAEARSHPRRRQSQRPDHGRTR